MSITVHFDYEPTDHHAALREVWKRTKWSWIRWTFIAIGTVLSAWTFWTSLADWPVSGALFAASPWIVVALFWAFFLPFLHRLTAKRLPRIDPAAVGPQKRGVTAEGFHSEGNGIRLELPWRAMHKAVETSDLFLFFYNKNFAYYIPKRAATPEQNAEIRNMMKLALGDRALVSE